MGFKIVKQTAEEFTNGTPVSRDITLEDGIIFSFDNPHESDLTEYFVVATVIVHGEKFPKFSPETGDEFNKLPTLDAIDGQLRRTLLDGGFTRVSGPEFDSTNSTDKLYYFRYTLIQE